MYTHIKRTIKRDLVPGIIVQMYLIVAVFYLGLFIIIKVEDVPELMLTSVILQHDKTGAEHLHVARDDSNNTFR